LAQDVAITRSKETQPCCPSQASTYIQIATAFIFRQMTRRRAPLAGQGRRGPEWHTRSPATSTWADNKALASATRPPARPNLSNLCRKTKLCTLFKQGMCVDGDLCAFAHGEDELRAHPDLRSTRICPNLLARGQCLVAACKFAHGDEEVRRYSLGRPDAQEVVCDLNRNDSTCCGSSIEEIESEGSNTDGDGFPLAGTQLEVSIKNTFIDLRPRPRHSSQRPHSVPCRRSCTA
jgi:hypothetical protein